MALASSQVAVCHALNLAQLREFQTRAEILALFDDRVTWDTIRHWRTGKHGAPQWAIDRLRERAATTNDLRPGPGRGGALMAWLRAHGRLPAKENPPS